MDKFHVCGDDGGGTGDDDDGDDVDDDDDDDGGKGVTTEDDGVKESNTGKNVSPADSTVAKLVVVSLGKISSPP